MFKALKENGIEAEYNHPVRCKYGYIADFFISENKLIIECDGEPWHKLGNSRDRKRDAVLKKMGYKIHSSVDELIKDSQIISLHIPSTVQTENTIDEKRIRLMNENSIIINTARGDLIDETALIKALKDKKIGGAALDVYREEPLKNMDLCSCEENLVLTPHIGSQTEENQSQASIMIAEKISDYLKNLT